MARRSRVRAVRDRRGDERARAARARARAAPRGRAAAAAAARRAAAVGFHETFGAHESSSASARSVRFEGGICLADGECRIRARAPLRPRAPAPSPPRPSSLPAFACRLMRTGARAPAPSRRSNHRVIAKESSSLPPRPRWSVRLRSGGSSRTREARLAQEPCSAEKSLDVAAASPGALHLERHPPGVRRCPCQADHAHPPAGPITLSMVRRNPRNERSGRNLRRHPSLRGLEAAAPETT